MFQRCCIFLTCGFLSISSGTLLFAQAVQPPVMPPRSELAAVVERYSVDRTTLTRRYNVEYSTERYDRLTRFYKDWQTELSKIPFAPLSVDAGSITCSSPRGSITSSDSCRANARG